MKNLYFFIIILLLGCSPKPIPEAYRPQVHFSPKKKWINDPNGLVFKDGTYHLFFQHYPDSTVWGPMHWGHATSKDLVHWEEKPIALYPDSLGWIFSGSIVTDHKNSSGLGTKTNPPMVAIYTYHNDKLEKNGRQDFQYQGLAFSLDNGRSWKKYTKNPVLPNPGLRDFRDPKVIWSDPHQKWVMALAVANRVHFYSSDNLISWKFESAFGEQFSKNQGVWECPDLFPMTYNGKTYWVLLVSIGDKAPNGGSGTQYFVGDFDGTAFRPTGIIPKWLDYGKDNYAGVTWADAPEPTFIGWMNNWQYAQRVPTSTWRGAMTLPRKLSLKENNGDFRLLASPIVGSGKRIILENQKIIQKTKIFSGELAPMDVELNLQSGKKNFSVLLQNELGNTSVLTYDAVRGGFVFDNTANGWPDPAFAVVSFAPYQLKSETKLRMVIDRSSIEIFVDEGSLAMTFQFFPKTPFNALSVSSDSMILSDGTITKLR